MPSITREHLAAASFPHATTAVRVCETHISFVILTGEFAYKIKKAVHLDFLDTRALQRRRELCIEELRLNRRYAAELYLDVVPIAVNNGRLEFCGEGPAFEYAVRMRQFDVREELKTLLRERQISAAEIASLAEHLADFHERATPLLPAQHRATETFLRTARENLRSVVQRADAIDARARAIELVRWSEAQFEAQTTGLRLREEAGFIRECHGDLHSGNIVRWRGELIPFDCIEFDPELRFIDVLSDIAFLVMDLFHHTRSDLAFTLLNRYVERTGDYLSFNLLPIYLTYRALVRAKVELIAAQQPTGEQLHLEQAAAFLKTAESFCRRAKPKLILMHGTSGSGKSWLSERLVPQLPAVRIRSDVERKRLAGLAAMAPNTGAIDTGIYTMEFNERTYAHLLECARACLRGQLNAIVDAAFLKVAERRQFAALADEEGATFSILSCHADRDTLAERIAQRTAARNDASDATLQVLERQLATMQPLTAEESSDVIAIDTRDPDAVSLALARIGSSLI